MRLLVGARIYQALNSIRRATTPPVQQLQHLWDLIKETKGRRVHDHVTERDVRGLEEGRNKVSNESPWAIVQRFSEHLEFASIEKLLMEDSRFKVKEGQVPDVKIVTEVLWAAVLAKSLGSLAPSILDWIEEAVRRLPEPVADKKKSMIWLLSILRGDLPMLQQLEQKSSSKTEGVGPEIERRKTLKHAALAFLELRKPDDFRSLWTSLGTPLLVEEESVDGQQSSALLHHALLRSSISTKNDPAMLRWYAESLVSYQRTPIPAETQFEMMMEPVISALGGRIEKWEDSDGRIDKLRKWRDDYDDAELDKLVHSMIDYLRHQIVVEKLGSLEDLTRLEDMLSRLNSEKKQPTVIIDWLNFVFRGLQCSQHLNNYHQTHQLVIVGREKINQDDGTPKSPPESKRIKVMEVTCKMETIQEVDDFCSMVLAVATRGHLLSNDKIKSHIDFFGRFIKKESGDVTQATILKKYLNDAVLRHHYLSIQPPVDHSKAAQWINEEKNELAFTVARKTSISDLTPFRDIDYYSMHID